MRSAGGEPLVAARVGWMLCGKWQVGRLLGVGGMSTVYEAVHRNGRRVAVKILHPDLCLNERARGRFLREGYIANRVGHPGVVTILDDGVSEDGTVFLVLELLQGQTLGDRLRRTGPLPFNEVVTCADRVLDVLAKAHEHGIVHRDIKPENIFLTYDRTLKVLDFGIASLRELSAAGLEPTRSGAALGTPAFMAPEQTTGRRETVDHRADLWALGATMFTLLTGRHVHDAYPTRGSATASLGDFATGLDAAFVEVVDVALRSDPNARWADARSMQQALCRCVAEAPPALPVPSFGASGSFAIDGQSPSHSTVADHTDGFVRGDKQRGRARREFSAGQWAIAVCLLGGMVALPVSQYRVTSPPAPLGGVIAKPNLAAPAAPQPLPASAIGAAPMVSAAPGASTEPGRAPRRKHSRTVEADPAARSNPTFRVRAVSLTSDEILDRRE